MPALLARALGVAATASPKRFRKCRLPLNSRRLTATDRQPAIPAASVPAIAADATISAFAGRT